MSDARVFNYCDRVSTLVLWQKAFLLAPLWAIPLVPIAGLMTKVFGDLGVQVGFTALTVYFIVHFLEDLLKRKIRIENDVIFFGFKAFKLKDIVSVGLQYKGNNVCPTALLMHFRTGDTLKLKLSRLASDDFNALLRLVESRFPHCKIDPVVGSLSKCKKLVRRTLSDDSEKVEVSYHSHKLFRELAETFLATAGKWTRSGPFLVWLLALPIWSSFLTGLYVSWQYSSQRNIALTQLLEALSRKTYSALNDQVSSASTRVYEFLAQPLVSGVLLFLFLTVLFLAIRVVTRPNLLEIDRDKLALRIKILNFTIRLAQLPWSDVVRASLMKGSNLADSRQWRISFHRKSTDIPFEIQLGAIEPHDRTRLLNGLDRFAPNCSVETDLAEAMMPRQEKSYTEIWLQSLASAPERKSLDPLVPGQFLQEGRFEVLYRLGIGGQGMAYLCNNFTELDAEHKQVVLKETIIPLFVELPVRQQAVERFEQEARMLKQFDSERIVKLVDYFIEDHRGYLVLEHIEGQTLRQLVEENGALPDYRAHELAVQMCEILEVLHSKEIIHRDFTPDNLILSKDGTLKLIDFNVAQNTQTGATGTIVGKHAFVPPEQFRGKPTKQSDLYSMGATLFYLVTGKDPEPISRSSALAVGVNTMPELEAAMSSCTELSCQKRVGTIDEVRAILQPTQPDHIIRQMQKETILEVVE